MGARKGSNNGGGRNAVPASLINNKTYKKDNAELVERTNIEKSLTIPQELNKPPKGMSPRARQEWKRMLSLYREMDIQILCELDSTILRTYCEAVANYELASLAVEMERKKHKEQNKSFRLVNVDFELKQMDSLAKTIKSLADQLCLSPLARAKMGVALSGRKEKKATKPLDDLFDDDA